MPKEKADRFAAYAPGRSRKCKFAAIVDAMSMEDKADVIEAMEKYLPPTIARALDKEFNAQVSEEVVRRHRTKRCGCYR